MNQQARINELSAIEARNLFVSGLITQAEADGILDALSIRGGWSGKGPRASFTGYDYANQRWIEIN